MMRLDVFVPAVAETLQLLQHDRPYAVKLSRQLQLRQTLQLGACLPHDSSPTKAENNDKNTVDAPCVSLKDELGEACHELSSHWMNIACKARVSLPQQLQKLCNLGLKGLATVKLPQKRLSL